MKLIPHRNLFICLGFLAVLAVIVIIKTFALSAESDPLSTLQITDVFYGICALVTLLALFDGWQLKNHTLPLIQRTIAPSIAIDRPAEVVIELSEHRLGPLEIRDFVPDFCHVDVGTLKFSKSLKLSYLLTPKKRGPLDINALHLRFSSRMGLWQRIDHVALNTHTKVYPDFERVQGYELLAQANQSNQMGIRRKPRRGMGSDFHQLREYRQGDSLKQIDWNATARRQQLISREYQDERDQQIVFMLDSGRQMLATEPDEVSHFDHSLNALLLLSHLALKQGDWVSMMSFGAEQRKVSAVRGSNQINRILNQYYDLYASPVASDYEGACEQLIKWQRKRSLVIMVTNAREEQQYELLKSIKLLSKHHLVVVANLRESSLNQLLKQPIDSQDDAALYAASQNYLQQSNELENKIKKMNAIYLDCYPAQLLTELANTYLALKSQGRV
jgi:uncharacterized protein (DUF58 family)